MHPDVYLHQADAKRRDVERHLRHDALIRAAQAARPKTDETHPLARLGVWLVAAGERLETRYRLDEATAVTLNAH